MEALMRTIGAVLERGAKRNPDKVFLYFQKQEVKYREFDRKVNRLANSSTGLGICAGENVTVMLPNCPEYLFAFYALGRIGAVLIPLPTMARPPEIEYLIVHCESETLITDAAHWEYIRNSTDLFETDIISKLRNVILIDGEGEKAKRMEDLVIGASEEPPAVEVSDADLAVVMYTSGTTGKPKGRSYGLQGRGP